jgi:hypothetical protein
LRRVPETKGVADCDEQVHVAYLVLLSTVQVELRQFAQMMGLVVHVLIVTSSIIANRDWMFLPAPGLLPRSMQAGAGGTAATEGPLRT